MFGIFGKKRETKDVTKGNTFNITEGKIPLDRKKVEALQFALEEGMSDQTIMIIGKSLINDLNKAEKQLKDVV